MTKFEHFLKEYSIEARDIIVHKIMNGKTPKGYLVALRGDIGNVRGPFGIGYSLCKRGDKFDTDAGLIAATKRAFRSVEWKNVPKTVEKEFPQFCSRACKYFQVKDHADQNAS